MKNFKRAGILVVLIVIPAFLFVFLEFFGENVFSLPYKFPVGIKSENGTIEFFEDLGIDPNNSELFLSYGKPEKQGNDSIYFLMNPKQYFARVSSNRIAFVLFLSQEADGNIDQLTSRVNSRIGKQKVSFLKSSTMDRSVSILMELSKPKVPIAILVDINGFIRSVYRDLETETTDRLLNELEVLESELK